MAQLFFALVQVFHDILTSRFCGCYTQKIEKKGMWKGEKGRKKTALYLAGHVPIAEFFASFL